MATTIDEIAIHNPLPACRFVVSLGGAVQQVTLMADRFTVQAA